jgi:hypothetical protein
MRDILVHLNEYRQVQLKQITGNLVAAAMCKTKQKN